MFGKQITIRSEADALSLYGHLCRNPRHGNLVKRVHFQDSDISCALQEGLLSFIFKPNMEEMTGVLQFEYAFFHNMCRIANTSATKFDKLRVLPHPLYHSNTYDDTLIAFKDTLRDVVLVLGSDHTQAGRGIINYMMDFKSLVHLTLKGSLGTLFLMEDILQHCTTLKELSLQLHLTDNIHEKAFVENWAAPIVRTVSSVEKVTFKEECRSDQLEYIRIKYPQIKTLIIDMDSKPLIVSRNNIKRIIKAMIEVPTYNIKLLIKEENLAETAGHLLKEGCQFNIKQAGLDRFRIELESSPPPPPL